MLTEIDKVRQLSEIALTLRQLDSTLRNYLVYQPDTELTSVVKNLISAVESGHGDLIDCELTRTRQVLKKGDA
jgi:hypothetical protein